MARKKTSQKEVKERLLELLNEAIISVKLPYVEINYYDSIVSLSDDDYFNLSFRLKRKPNYFKEG
jgi:hypothetical protein